MAEKWCACGHARAAHEHFRPGSDCGACGAARCPAFRRTGRLAAVTAALRTAGRRLPSARPGRSKDD